MANRNVTHFLLRVNTLLSNYRFFSIVVVFLLIRCELARVWRKHVGRKLLFDDYKMRYNWLFFSCFKISFVVDLDIVRAMSKFARSAAKEAKKIFHSNIIETIIPTSGASPGPPLGPLLGQRGLPIAKFVADFNNLTKDFKPGIPLPTKIHVDGKKFTIQLLEPDLHFLIKQAAGIKDGERPADSMGAGMITYKHVYEIAKIKIEQEDIKIRGITMQEMCQRVANECEQLGVTVVREYDPVEYDQFLAERERLEAEYLKEQEELLLEAKKKLARKLLKEAK